MKNLIPMKSSKVRSQFIDYFKKNGHSPVESSSLVPDKDPTLLFTNAGMNQFKNLFLGLEKRDYARAVSSQKCVRAGGKHNDLENVGFTARHHTFFEMLGNFSFGDYFKSEAIHYAWELLTKELEIPANKLYVTVFQNDDEAANLWHKQEGVPRERIFRFGEKDNFWRMGETGPCGPCTEIFYDHGEKAGSETDAYQGILSGGDRYVEIWNLVMMQYFEKEPGVMEPLPKPSVDTGSGLERLSAVMQGKTNNYDTDLFLPLIDSALNLLPKEQELADLIHHETKGLASPFLNEKRAALRVLADHTRAITFLLADGVAPSNEGRGYVLRRILRRALRYQRKLDPSVSFFPVMINRLVQEMSDFYPEIKDRKNYVLNVVQDEENRFTQTLDQGTELLNEELKKLKYSQKRVLPGELVFKLYDTYGFPVDLTRLMASEEKIDVDETGFEREMKSAREKARASWKGKALNTDEAHLVQWSNSLARMHGPTTFTGYSSLTGSAQIIGLSNGQTEVTFLKAGDRGVLVANTTPFYGESGGQSGDKGHGENDHCQISIFDVTKQNNIYLHQIEITAGDLQVGTNIVLTVDPSERRKTAANHSATHLMHSALRTILGAHVHQAGSLVDANRLRFDFSHSKALTNEELKAVEALVNNEIAKGQAVECQITTPDEAIKNGAMALFGEKYGEEVRVIKMGTFSQELCGGTHVTNTSHIRLFKIVSESGVSAGVRRIEALSGDSAFTYFLKHLEQSLAAREAIGAQESWTQFLESQSSPLSNWIDEKRQVIRTLEKELKVLKVNSVNLDELIQGATSFTKGSLEGNYVVANIDVEDRETLAQINDQLKNRLNHGLVITIGKGTDDSHPIIVTLSKSLVPALNAGQILKELCQQLGGKGGGRPDFAQGAILQKNSVSKTLEKYLRSGS